MWLTVTMLVAPALWLNIRAENEILQNGLPEKCGKRLPLSQPPKNYDGRKREAQPHSWPWHVGLYFSEFGAFPYCGGTLIAPTWVLTAAHCITSPLNCKDIPLGRPFAFNEFTDDVLVIKVGSHNFKNDHDLAYNVMVKHVIMHPTFPLNGPKSHSDFALLKLTREVQRSETVAFACLPKSGLKFMEGKKCNTAGWGLITPSAPQPEVLMEQPATIIKTVACKETIRNPNSKKNICIQQSFTTICSGDSGGGLHCPTEDGNWTLYGVFSRSTARCEGSFALFGATDYALPWIKRVIQAYN